MTTLVSLIPETAPFNTEQREWLNGFLAGWLGLQETGTATAVQSPPAPSSTQLDGVLGNDAHGDEEADDFPWHDGGIPIEERLALAEGKPLKRRLMAAMAQLDCGACGYVCKTYAEAIARGEETSLKLCSPGGKETSRKLKELLAESGGSSPDQERRNGHPVQIGSGTREKEWSRQNPFPAKVLAVRNLNGDGSAKHTSHVELDLAGSGLTYDVGDALGVYPTNCRELVESLQELLHVTEDEPVTTSDGQRTTLGSALTEHCCLTEITDGLLETLRHHCLNPGELDWLSRLMEDDSLMEGWDVRDLLEYLPSIRLPAAEFVSTLSPLKPRLYSISSSLKAHPGQVHLTVGRVAWDFRGRTRKGVTSTMFSDRLRQGETVRVFVQKSHGFTVPRDPDAGMIMIGPGTGIAPFRAFLEERAATNASGPNWLFFGDQKSETDFLYREELEAHRSNGTLHRLDTAFSRDSSEKVYVQHRMQAAADELFHWLKNGACVYVCGDARRMAVDVDRALHAILARRVGGEEQATAYLEQMKKEKRYCRDVY